MKTAELEMQLHKLLHQNVLSETERKTVAEAIRQLREYRLAKAQREKDRL